jgi:hypothetical protein
MFRAFIPVLLLAALAACNSVVDPSKNVVEAPRMGLIQKGTGNSGPLEVFSTSKNGEVSITVTAMTPSIPSNLYFAVSYGQYVSGQCLTNSVNQFAVVGSPAISGSIFSGSYCFFIQDEGLFTTDETYTVSISHP